MAVKLSERAAEEVKRFQTEHNFGDDMVLRIGIAAGGCSGFSYTLNFDDSFDDKADTKYECHGVAVVVDKKSALYLDGTLSTGTKVWKSKASHSRTQMP